MEARVRALVLVTWMALLFLVSTPGAPSDKELARIAPQTPAPEWVLAAGNVWRQVRRPLGTLNQTLRWVGANQGWTMFSGVDTTPIRLEVEIQRDGDWQLVHRTGDPQHTWNARQLREPRLRATQNLFGRGVDNKHRKRWNGFTDWLGQRALTDFPDASAVRFTLVEQTAPDAATLRSSGWPAGERLARRKVSR